MGQIITALFPVFSLLMIGNILRRTHFLGESFWSQVEKFTYYILFPALLIHKLGHADISWQSSKELLIAIPLFLLAGTILSHLIKPILKIDNAGFTSVYQASIRFNSYVGLAVISILLPEDALAIAAIVLAVMIPIVNLLCILIFSINTGPKDADKKRSLSKVLISTLKNPLILGCLTGIFISITGLPIPNVVYSTLDHLGSMALPMGLLAVGAGLHFKVLHSSGVELTLTSLIKLFFMPLIAFGLGKIIGMDTLTLSVFLVFSASPTASSSYILAKQLGGNAHMMSALITGQTLLSMVTIPLLLQFLM